MSLISVVLLLGGAHGLYLSYALYHHNNKADNANLLLSLFTLCLSLFLFYSFLDTTEYLRLLPHLTKVNEPLLFAFAPLLYIYVIKITSRSNVEVNFLHFAPSTLVTLFCIPFYLSSAAIKVEYLYAPIIQSEEALWFEVLFDNWLHKFAFLFVGFYLLLIGRVLIRHIKNLKDRFSYTDNIDLKWLITLVSMIAFLYLMWVFDEVVWNYDNLCSQAKVTFGCDNISDWFGDDGTLILVNVGMAVCVYLISLLALRQPNIYRRQSSVSIEDKTVPVPVPLTESMPTKQSPIEEVVNDDKLTIDKASDTKYKNSPLDDDQAAVIFNELQSHITKDRPYLVSTLTLEELSTSADIPRHYLSQAINQKAKKNFFDFINEFRINEAKSLLLNHPKQSVTDIYINAGFNSRSAFYNAFKKYTGLTPNQYRQQKSQPGA